ncbi:MAG TPA: hypothetical protein VEQ63_10705, partial [Bryobacteraceae bacterium]|nr:hypothetical protein [Bryobacteraceae bacterium]
RKLGAYPIYGSVSKPVATVESRTVTPEEWLAACSRLELAGESILQLDLSAAELEYQLQDPWGRQCAVAYNTATQEIVGAGIAAHTRSVTAQGCQTMATLHHVRCTTADALRSLVWYASTWKDGEPRGPIVTLPNRTGISDEILRHAGVRAMPTRFFGYIFGQDENHPIFQAERTSFEVI